MNTQADEPAAMAPAPVRRFSGDDDVTHMEILPELSIRPEGWVTDPRAATANGKPGIIASALDDVPAESPAFTGPGALRYAIDLTSKLSQGMNLNSEEIVAAKRLGVMVPTRIPAIPNHPIPQIPGLR